MKHISGKVNLVDLVLLIDVQNVFLGKLQIDEEKQKCRIRESKKEGEKQNQGSFTFVEGVKVETWIGQVSNQEKIKDTEAILIKKVT